MSSDPSSKLRASVDALAAVVAAGAAFLLALAPVSDVDFFWHLAVGRHIAQTGALPVTNLWSFTAPTHSFEATAWLFDWLAYRVQTQFGVVGIQLLCAVVLGLAFALVYLAARRLGASVGWGLALTLAGEAASQTRFTQRPHALSYLFLALLALLFIHARERAAKWPLFVAPGLVALWSNFHAGAVFGAGLAGLAALAAWIDHLRLPAPDRPRPSALAWSLAAAACCVALIANPSGTHELSYALFHLRNVNEVVTLGEFGTPGLQTHSAFWVLLGVGVLALLGRGRRVDVSQALTFVAFAFLSVRAMYVAPMFTIVTVPITASLLTRRGAAIAHRLSRPFTALLTILAPPLALVAGLGLAPEPLAYFISRIEPGLDPFKVPEAGAAMVKSMGITGRCFASWDLSGFAEWTLPESPVYVDPRLLAYPPEVFTDLAAADDSQEAFDALMDRTGVEWAFRSHTVLRMSGIGRFPSARWALVYWDEASMILLRRGVPKFEALIRDHELHYFLPASSPFESWRALSGEARDTWVKEIVESAARSPLLGNAQAALCLEATRGQAFDVAGKACEAGFQAARLRERFHPLEGAVRRAEAAVAMVMLGQALQRIGVEVLPDLVAKAEVLAPDSPEVLTVIGGVWITSQPKRALGFFNRALKRSPDFPPAVKGRELALHSLGER